jgi:hypothetical protein
MVSAFFLNTWKGVERGCSIMMLHAVYMGKSFDLCGESRLENTGRFT